MDLKFLRGIHIWKFWPAL